MIYIAVSLGDGEMETDVMERLGLVSQLWADV